MKNKDNGEKKGKGKRKKKGKITILFADVVVTFPPYVIATALLLVVPMTEIVVINLIAN